MIVKDSELEIFVACLNSLTRAEQIDSQGPAVPAARGESFATMIPVRDPSSQQGAVRMSCFFFPFVVLWCFGAHCSLCLVSHLRCHFPGSGQF